MLLEGAQLVRPEHLDLVEPAAQPREGLVPQLVDPHPRVIRVGRLGHQAAPPQHPQVSAHRRSAHRERLGQLARSPRLLAQQIDHATARRICQRRQRPVDVAHAAGGLRTRSLNHQW
jgi:hypothetical protein